ncbi:MAG: hypothetical protein VX520_07845, partial [Planctomycetota bacterium]|nr:hypothetical protein [Planctomycetota bacterium]
RQKLVPGRFIHNQTSNLARRRSNHKGQLLSLNRFGPFILVDLRVGMGKLEGGPRVAGFPVH